MMYCHKCGSKLPEGAGFCFDCGAAQNNENQTAPTPEQTTSKEASIIQPKIPAPVYQAPNYVQRQEGQRPSIYEGFGFIKAINVSLIVGAAIGVLSIIGSPLENLLRLLENTVNVPMVPLLLAAVGIAQHAVFLIICLKGRSALKNRRPGFINLMFYLPLIGVFAYVTRFVINLLNSFMGSGTSPVLVSFVSGLVSQMIGVAMGLGIITLILAKSQQIKTWFRLEVNAVRYSRFWPWLSKLPPAMIDENFQIAVPTGHAHAAQQPTPQQASQTTANQAASTQAAAAQTAETSTAEPPPTSHSSELDV